MNGVVEANLSQDIRREHAEALAAALSLLRDGPIKSAEDGTVVGSAAMAAARRLIQRYGLAGDPGFPDGPEPAGDVLVTRPGPVVYRGSGGGKPHTDDGRRPKYFLVTSQGLAGSAWLASSLNLHPQITCAMGIDHPLVSMRHYYNDDLIREKTAHAVREENVRHGFYSESLRHLFTERFRAQRIVPAGNLVRDNPIRTLQHMFDELEWFAPESTYYGNVHVCSAAEAEQYLNERPTRSDVVAVNLIRHPVPRTEASITAVMRFMSSPSDSDWHKNMPPLFDAFAEGSRELRRNVEKDFGVDFRDVRNRAVLYAYYGGRHNDHWANEITGHPDVYHVTMERLMSDRDHFAWLAWELTGRQAAVSPDLLDRIFTEEHLQSGRYLGRGRSLGPRAQYDAWTGWERDEFRQAAYRLNLADVYAPFGYDFSFVR